MKKPYIKMPQKAKSSPFLIELRRLLDVSPKTQVEIANEAGFLTPNIISMIKYGQAKLPPRRIPALARSLGADPDILMRKYFEEFQPELLELITKHAGAFQPSVEHL